MNREFVMLSHSLKLSEALTYSLGNWFVSEKLDGMRALWLPDTVGVRVSELPFANLDKDRTDTGRRNASGLWSRYAKPIWAPDWFIKQLPRDRLLDGELWCGRKQFQRLTSIVKQGTPDERWHDVDYCVFDSPSPDVVYRDGKIWNGTLKKNFRGVWEWCKSHLPYDYKIRGSRTFDYTYFQDLKPLNPDNTGLYLKVHHQEQLSWRHIDAVSRLNKLLDEVLDGGGEGLIVRAPHSIWEPIRHKLCLKVKRENDAEGVVVGYTMGEGRLEGMIGSLWIKGELNGRTITFGLSGLTDAERAFPSSLFPVGTIVSYVYRETTTDGIPREARFSRLWCDL